MHGDFTLDPLQYRDDVSRVFVQQGRVELDSDRNEATEATLRFLRGLGRDIIGPHGGVYNSFEISQDAGELWIQRGEYYVDGIRCLLREPGDPWELYDPDPAQERERRLVLLEELPNFVPPAQQDQNRSLLYYLDVYERHVSAAEDESLREVALLGADTASRALVTWRIRTLVIDNAFRQLADRTPVWPFHARDGWYIALNLRLRTAIRMRAEAIESESTNPCIISPKARYRGMENRLFRVEIHGDGTADPGPEKPTLKWSQDNGSVVYPIRRAAGNMLFLGSLGRDARTRLCVNDWVEVVDDDSAASNEFHPLLQVVDVHDADMSVELNQAPGGLIGTDPAKHPILRRWASDLIEIDLAAPGTDAWIELADGVKVEFTRVARPEAGFRPGDYWLIPTRTEEGQILWPQDAAGPRAMPPNGVDHHYAPLFSVVRDAAAVTLTPRNRPFQYLTP